MDPNSDNIHKEDFNEAMTVLLALSNRILNWLSRTTVASRNLAVLTAMTCYNTLDAEKSFFLQFDECCACYSSARFEIMQIYAIEVQSRLESSFDSMQLVSRPLTEIEFSQE